MRNVREARNTEAKHLGVRRHPIRSRLGSVALVGLVASTAGVVAIVVDSALTSPDSAQASTPNVATPSQAGPSQAAAITPANSAQQQGVPEDPAAQWKRVLERLNIVRAHAWEQAKPDNLTRVFATHSDVLATDQKALCDYVLKGLHVDGVQLQIGDVVMNDRGDDWVKLTVVDRLGPVEVVDGIGRPHTMPRDQTSLHQVMLTKAPDGWRIASVRAG